MSDKKHSPLPWGADIEETFGDEIEIVDPTGRTVCTVDYDDGFGVPDATLICLTVNSHADLLAACEMASKACRENLAVANYKNEPLLLAALNACEAALRKAKGE